MSSYTRLTLAEREEISRHVATGRGPRAIARQLGRAPSTISRELRRADRTPRTYRAAAAARGEAEVGISARNQLRGRVTAITVGGVRTGELLDPLKGLCHGASPVGSRLAAAVSYRAAWTLPEPDSHRLVDVSLREITRCSAPPPSSGVPLPGHAETGATPHHAGRGGDGGVMTAGVAPEFLLESGHPLNR